MREALEKSVEELKRIDHLIYVTLKYTRTVDVLISVIDRIINSYEFAIEALLKYALSQGKIETLPEIPMGKAQKLIELYDKPLIKQNMDMYFLFRKLKKARCEREKEYRRHVAMICNIEGQEIEINIDNITEYYHLLKKFVDFIYKLVIEQ